MEKPTESIDKLTELLDSQIHGNDKRIIIVDKDHDFFHNDSVDNIFLLQSGQISIRRVVDGKVVISVEPPSILGLTRLFESSDFHFLKTERKSIVISYNINKVKEVLNQFNAWVYVSEILSYITNLYYERDALILHGNVYSIVKAHIEKISSLPEEERNSTSIFDFILNRVPISRSSLNKIIKELEYGGHIETKRGKLIMSKKLPSKF